MRPALELLLDAFVRACLDVFGEQRVEGIVLHGSAVKGGFIPGYSDLDLMVFLTPDCFDGNGALPDETVFAVQERIGPLPWQEAGFRYPQAYFYDARRLPAWWTGPPPGAHRVLWGALPPEARPSPEGVRRSARDWLARGLHEAVAADLHGFIDADDASIPRRLRLLGTRVTPTMFAVLTLEADDPIALWAQPKDAALEQLRARYPGASGPNAAGRFYEAVRRLYGAAFDPDAGRTAFRDGIAFLRWAEGIGAAPS